jgi:hypothetical protein
VRQRAYRVERPAERRPGQGGAVHPHLVLGQRLRQLLRRYHRTHEQHPGGAVDRLAGTEQCGGGEQQRRQLEAVGLIKVASTRVVSGILEQRYQASQQDLIFGRGFIREHADESIGLMQTLLDRFRDGFFAAFQANRQSAGDETAVEPYRKPVLLFSDVKISPAKAAELRDKLEEIMNDLNDRKTEDPNGIPVNLLIGCFVPGEIDPGTQ